MNDLEKDFIASFKSLMIRYNIDVKKCMSGFEDDNEVEWVFSTESDNKEKRINVKMDDIHTALIAEKLFFKNREI